MNSLLTRKAPHIWQRGLTLATELTGYAYLPKLPRHDGTIWACGDGGGWLPEPPRPSEPRPAYVIFPEEGDPEMDEPNEHQPKVPAKTLAVFVPDGAMEWLLHEVGHYVAASPEERLLRDYGLSASSYGHDGDREWQALAFEEITLAPFGPARHFVPPTHRGGFVFDKAGPMPRAYLDHVERQIRELHIDVEAWRLVWSDWVRWGQAQGTKAPWCTNV